MNGQNPADEPTAKRRGNDPCSNSHGGSSAPTDRDRLFGRIALANGFIDRETLDGAITQLVDSTESLEEVLIKTGALTAEDRRAIEQLLERVIARHDDDPEKSLSAIDPTASFSASPVPETVNFPPEQSKDDTSSAGDFGGYELIEVIAKGGMGVVYKARQKKLNRLVALKMIRSGEFANDEQVKRFHSEAEAAGNLDHSGIVPVYEVGQAKGQHFYSMAFVEGQSLHSKVKDEGPLDAKEAASLMRNVAKALQLAHGKGIVHRDIKPHNILLDEGGQPRVTDFGLAKQIHGDSDLTATGQVIGTPSYMSPEQATGNVDKVGVASDVYSMGATLYFMLTGHPPFQAASAVQTIRQVIDVDPVPLRRWNPEIPRDLETICMKCLRKDSSKRYLTASEFAEDVGRWLEKKPISARPVSRAEKVWLWCKRRPTVAGSIAAILLATLIVTGIVVGQKWSNARRIAKARIENDRKRASSHVENALTASAAGLPYAIQLVEPFKDYAVPILQDRFNDPDGSDAQRLHAAIALAEFGDVRVEFLVSNIETAPAGECPNIVSALARSQDTMASIGQKAKEAESETTPDWGHKARLAVAALHLGDASMAEDMCRSRPNPIQRTVLVDTLSKWHGDLADLAEIIGGSTNESVRSSVIRAVGQMPGTGLAPRGRRAWQSLLIELYQSSPEPGTHSACDFAMRKLQLDASQISETNELRPGQLWHINSIGMTMLQVPAGKFRRQRGGADKNAIQEVTVSRPFWLADRETSITQYQEFLADSGESAPAQPATGEEKGILTPDASAKPVEQVSFEDALQFCNWLSRREGLVECYQREDSIWEWDQSANGYRLPTEAEWEYACRANSATLFAHGDDEAPLHSYAVCRAGEVASGGSRMPNSFGFFDLPGNVNEWCFDEWRSEYSEDPSVVDPIGPTNRGKPTSLVGRVTRGGSYRSSSYSLRSASRSQHNPSTRPQGIGFRVAMPVF